MTNRIKDILKDQGRTQVWLAEQLGISKSDMWKYCANYRQPGGRRLVNISVFLGVPCIDIVIK